MKNWGKRLLALALSVALLIGCTVSGLVLPATAQEASAGVTQAATPEVFNFFPDGDFENGSVDFGFEIADGVGLGGSKALVIPPNTSNKKMKTVTLRQKLVPGGAYVIRYKVKSLNHSVYWTDTTYAGINGSLPATNYQETDKFIQYQYMFTPVNETDQFAQFGLYNTHATKEAYIDEFEIFEYKPGLNVFPDDTREEVAALAVTMVTNKDKDTGEFTIFPGGVFGPFVKSGITVTDAQDGNNNVIKFSGLNATDGNEAVLPLASLCYNKSVFDVNRDVIISFRYKSENDAATVRISAANSEVGKVNGKPTTTAPDENGWRTHTARIKLHKISLSGTARLHFSGATEVLIDDFYCAQGTGLELSDLMWNPNGVQLQSETPLQFSVNLSNKGTVDLGDYSDITVDFVARNGDTTVNLGTMVQKGGLKAGQSVTLTLPNKWTPPVGEWVVSANASTTYLGDRENIGAQGHFRVEETRLQAPPEALAGGYDTLTFSDEFNAANVDTEYTGDYGYKWYLTDLTDVCGDKDDYSIKDGVMTLAGDNMRYNWLMATMDGNTAAGWHGFKYGYLEYRTRFDSVPEGWIEGTDYSKIKEEGVPNAPAIWSFPPEVICSSKLGYLERYVEMDWMEYWGYDKNNCQWTITMHDQTRLNNSNQTVTNSVNNRGSNHILDTKNNIGDGQWHTVGYRWEKGLLIVYLDGREIFYQDWSENGHYPEGIAAIGELTADAFTPLDNQLSPLILAGSKGWPLEIDYIRVWQKNEQDPHAYPIVDNETTVEALHWAPNVTSATPLTDDNTLYWHSANSMIASVANGVISTHHEGKTVITAYRGKKAVQQYVVTVDNYGECIPFGDFEHPYNDDHKALNGNGETYGIVVDGKGSITTESDGNRALMLPAGQSGYLNGLSLEAGKTYRLTGRVKGDAGVTLLGFYTSNIYDSNDYTGEKKPVTSGNAGKWVDFCYTFTTTAVENGAYKLDKSYTVSLRNSNGTTPAYFDNLSLVETDGFLVQGVGTSMLLNNYTKQALFYMCFDSSLDVGNYNLSFTSSSKTSVLERNSNSQLTAKACGTSNVTVKATPKAGGTALTKTIKFTVVDGCELVLSNSAVNLLKGDTKTLQASVTSGTLGTVTYTSDNTAVATVDQNGKITAVGEGLATITATTADALSATCDVVVQNRPTVAIDETAANVWIGESVNLNAAATPAGAIITWTSSDNAVATVANGVVTTHKAGTATITASVYGGATDTVVITVAKKPTVAIAEQSINLYCEQTKTLTTTVDPQDSAVVWTSSDNTVATVANGVVTALKAGSATITATVDGGNFATCVVNVANKPTIRLDKTAANVWTGETVTLNATVSPQGTAVVWTSSDNTVATVQNGVVTTRKAGVATITATVDGGNYATCVVTVADKPKLTSFGVTMNGLGLHFLRGAEATKENVDGIRFGTKLDFGSGYTTINDVLYLPYNNEYYEVVSMGAILRRHETGTELTVENARWTSEAYNSTDNVLRCIEFTEEYVVFAVNMMTKEPSTTFNERRYDARGYVQLNIDGVITTIYTDVVTDSVNEAYARATGGFVIIPGEEEDIYDD